MTLTTAQAVRLKIMDIPALVNTTYYGDGTANSFLLPHRNVTGASAFVPLGATAWSATGATFDPTGQVMFSGVISANSAFRVTYQHSTFSDDEIGHFTTVGGDVNGAAIEAVVSLMFDGTRRAKWAAPDGSEYDDTAAIQQLKDIYSALNVEKADQAIAAGFIASWSENQGYY